jgi:hypothetical protein
VTTAFQFPGFQKTPLAFQIESIGNPAFQQCAFQNPGFQAEVCSAVTVICGYDRDSGYDTETYYDNCQSSAVAALEPAGHWKHLIRAAVGAETPVVVARMTTRGRALTPATVQRKPIPAVTCSVRGSVTSRWAVPRHPVAGARTPAVALPTTTMFAAPTPFAGAKARFARGSCRSSGGSQRPTGGAGTCIVAGSARTSGWVYPPETIRNPPPEELLVAVW